MGQMLGADVAAADRLSRLMNETGQSFQDRAALLSSQLTTGAQLPAHVDAQ